MSGFEQLHELDPPAVVQWWRPEIDDAFAAFLADGRRLAVDTETTGVGWGDTVKTVQVGDEREAWVIPATRLDVIRRALDRRWLMAWNAAFDCSHIARLLGVPFDQLIACFVDTSVLAGLYDPRAAYQGGIGRGLKEWARHVCGDAGDLYDRQRKTLFLAEKLDWATVDPRDPIMLRYAGSDPILTARVHQHLANLVGERRDTAKREQRVMRVLAKMRHRGLAIDLERCEEACLGYVAEETAILCELAPLGVESAFKRGQVIDALREEGFGRLLTKQTGGGDVSVDKAVLAMLTGRGSHVAAKVNDAKRQHRFAEYCIKFAKAGAVDDRVHASINGIGAKTRRMSVSSPPLQQVPKREIALRSMFAPGPGMAIVRADFSSMELRYMGALSGDPTLLADIADNVPIFEELGEFVFGQASNESEARWQRDTAKMAVYAMSYGAGPTRITASLGIAYSDADDLLTAWRDRYEVLHQTFADALAQVDSCGGVELPRSGWLPSDPERPYVGLNLLVQGGCRDEFVDRILALDDAGLGEAMVLPYHDEMVTEVAVGDVAEVAHLMQTVMPIQFDTVRIEVEATSGETWGAAYQKGTAVSYALDELDDEETDEEVEHE